MNKKVLSIVFVAVMCLTVLFTLGISAAGTPTVEIVSFLRGSQTDLRSSELLEARVTGYDGNVRELTYEWTNEIGTYLYVFNNHNMYGIEGTDGEIEIYNDEVDSSANMAGRSYDTTFSGTGYAWAAIYGANFSNSDLLGTITVRVKDANGNVIATDTHTGTRSGRWGRYTYSGFVTDSLAADLQATAFGIFEGDSKHIRELFSESSIVHITCVESSVSTASVTSGGEHINLVNNGDGTYTITALSKGTSVMSMTVSKGNCKFHQQSNGSTTTTVYVYKKPVPTPTTTTITLTNLDDSCTYYINGNQGKRQDDGTIIFEGLTPNTTYTIEAQGYTEGTEVVYAYTSATTLPVYNAQVHVYLDGGYDIATATAYGTLINISDIRATDNQLFIREQNGTEYIPLVNVSTGIYTAGVANGTYHIYRDADEASMVGGQQLDMYNADRTRYLFYYSVSYDANGGTPAPTTEYYYEADTAYVNAIAPTKEGYAFAGWQDEDGNIYQPGGVITTDIEKPYKLTAIWKKTADVYVNINIDHISDNSSGHNNDNGKHNVAFAIDARAAGSTGDYIELASKTILWDGVSAFTVEGYSADHTMNGNVSDITAYTATAPTFTDMLAELEYTFTSEKSGYSIKSVTVTSNEDGDIIIDAELIYDPNNFDLVFTVELDEDAKALPDELKPVSVDVKVTAWHDSPYIDGEDVTWSTISHLHETYIKVDLDENGTGSRTYPVWIATTDTHTPYSYRIEVVSYVLPDGSVMAAKDVDNAHEYYTTDDERYIAYIEVTGGKDPNTSDSDTLTGVWYENGAQQGSVKAIISIEVFDVTLDPNGGAFSDSSTADKVLEHQLAVPALGDYTPTRDGGYTFLGWYLADENGNMTDSVVSEGDMLESDITLIAKWADPLTVEGTVSIAGIYYDGDHVHIIYDTDRVKTALVLLQKIDANGYPTTFSSHTVDITYSGDMGTGTYSFDGIPNDGSEYRVRVVSANYDRLYQNEASSSTVVTDYDAYDSEHYTAVFGTDDTAMVNVYLPFNPATFDLEYKVDATAIGEGFRPTSTDILVLCDDGLNGTDPQSWAVISQMVHGGAYLYDEVAISGGTGNSSFAVWDSKADGSTFYDYAIIVKNYTVGGEEKAFDRAVDPFMIHYNGSARYSAVNGQTQLLTATLVPKMYTVTYELDAGDETVTGMDNYETTTGAYQSTYYWSHGTAITALPIRDNHVFLGWFDADGNEVTSIAPEMAEDVVLTARWQALPTYTNDFAYIYGYSDTTMGAEGTLIRCELSAMIHRLVKQNNELGGFVYNSADTPDFSDIGGTWFRSAAEYMNYKGAVPASDTFAPLTPVTRGEAFKYVCLGLSFVDDNTLSYEEYAQFLYNAGYIIGDGSGNLDVSGVLTRAQFCTMYNRIIGREDAFLIDADGNDITAETYGFTDLDEDAWYYPHMLRATSAYDAFGYVDVELRGIRNNLDDYGA